MTLEQNTEWSRGFEALAIGAGLFSLLMSVSPALVYMGMISSTDRSVEQTVLLRALLQGGLPILLLYGVALLSAVRLRSRNRSGSNFLLWAIFPASAALMIYVVG